MCCSRNTVCWHVSQQWTWQQALHRVRGYVLLGATLKSRMADYSGASSPRLSWRNGCKTSLLLLPFNVLFCLSHMKYYTSNISNIQFCIWCFSSVCYHSLTSLCHNCCLFFEIELCYCYRFLHLPSKSKRRKALGRAPAIGHPRLFGGVIEEYVEVSDNKNFAYGELNISCCIYDYMYMIWILLSAERQYYVVLQHCRLTIRNGILSVKNSVSAIYRNFIPSLQFVQRTMSTVSNQRCWRQCQVVSYCFQVVHKAV